MPSSWLNDANLIANLQVVLSRGGDCVSSLKLGKISEEKSSSVGQMKDKIHEKCVALLQDARMTEEAIQETALKITDAPQSSRLT